MPSSVQAYQVTITNGNTNASPSDGFVDNKTLQNYDPDLQAATSLTLDNCTAKRRGNWRWLEIVQQVQLVANCYVDPHSFDSDATAIAEATSFAFQFYAEHGDDSLITADELNTGSYLTSTACLVRCIARALTKDVFVEIDIFDPTKADSIGTLGAANSEIRWGIRISPAADFEVGAYEADLATAETFVTVAKI